MSSKMIVTTLFVLLFLATMLRSSVSNPGPNPEYISNYTSTPSGTQYAPFAPYGFQTNWTADNGISTVLFETDLNSTLTNYTIGCSGATTNKLCIINFTDLTAGSYQYRWIANDTFNNFNTTGIISYSISKNTSAATRLYLNGTENNIAYGQNQVANFTASLNVSGKTIYIGSNYTGWVLQSGANSLIKNLTTLSSSGNTFNITAYWNGDMNYTASSRTYFFNVTVAYLEVKLISPAPSATTNLPQNRTFTVNATVYCRGGNCGSVNGTAMYNLSTSNPDVPINTTQGDKPFYVQESPYPSQAMKSCPTNPLGKDDYCNITWTVNATGNINSGWKIGTLFNSSYASMSQNSTDNATTVIVTCAVNMTFNFGGIDFGTITPSTSQNAALGNSGMLYNVTVEADSCNTDLYVKGTDLTNSSLGSCCNTIGVGNMTFGNLTNNYGSSYNFTTSYQVMKLGLPQNGNMTSYYWLNVPAVYAGGYGGNVTITGVKNGDPSP